MQVGGLLEELQLVEIHIGSAGPSSAELVVAVAAVVAVAVAADVVAVVADVAVSAGPGVAGPADVDECGVADGAHQEVLLHSSH